MSYKVNPRDFIHENDKKALDALKAIPGFDQFTKAFMKVYSERAMKIFNMSSKIRLSPEQCPRIYNLLPPICEKFGIEVPELYLEMNPAPNAYTSGDTYVYITVTTGLLELMDDEEIQTVLAHECGHIICHHVLYQTMGQTLLNGTAALLGLNGFASTALSAAFDYWNRCSEFSADRAAAVFCGSAERISDVMLRLAGGSKETASEIDLSGFMAQANDYTEYVSDSKWNRILEFMVLRGQSHPFLAVRASSIDAWCHTERFQKIVDSLAETTEEAKIECCIRCGKKIHKDWAFCRFCGEPQETTM